MDKFMGVFQCVIMALTKEGWGTCGNAVAMRARIHCTEIRANVDPTAIQDAKEAGAK